MRRKLPAGVPASLKFGSVVFRLFLASDGRLGFRYKHGSGWKQSIRRDLATLRADAERTALAIGNAETEALDVDAGDRRIYVAAREVLAPLNLQVDAVARDAAEAHRIVGAVPLRELALFYKRNAGARIVEKKVEEVAVALKAEVGERDLSGRFKRDVRNDLARFEAAFAGRLISEVTPEEILAWLRAEQAAAGFGWKRRNHLRSAAVYLFSHAKRMSWLPHDRLTAAESVKPLEEPKKRGPITTYTSDEMRAWIANIRPRFLPWLLICGFATVRSEEVSSDPQTNKDALRWSDFRWKKKFISIRRETSKVGEPRHVPMPANLIAWLEPWHDATGLVCPGEQPSKTETGRLGRITGTEIDGRWVQMGWRPNALRHTVISARLAIVKNRAQVAEEAGTSEVKIRKHYNEPMEEDLARAWFAIEPERAQNILPLWQYAGQPA
jgi:hypothetical protein